MIKPSKLNALLAGAALLAALPLTGMAQAKDPVKIALVTSKSGGFATMGADVANGIKFAVDEANAKGGVDGRKIIVVEGDDESTPDAGRRVAEKLARDGHNLIIGPITSGISLLAKPLPSSLSLNRQTRCARKSQVIRSPCQSAGKCSLSTISSPQCLGLPGFRPFTTRSAS